MPKARSNVLTEAEQRVMRVLWLSGEASVRDVTDALAPTYPVAYTTVLTILRILTDKDYVTPRQEGRAFVYRATVTRAEARTRALRKLVGQFFEGSPTALAQHLIQNEGLSAAEIDALRSELDDVTAAASPVQAPPAPRPAPVKVNAAKAGSAKREKQ